MKAAQDYYYVEKEGATVFVDVNPFRAETQSPPNYCRRRNVPGKGVAQRAGNPSDRLFLIGHFRQG